MTHQESENINQQEREDKVISNNKAGGQKHRENMIAKYGSEEAYREFMRNIAKKGGEGSRGYLFAHGKVDPREAAKLGASKGGKKSKRAKKDV